MVTVLDSFEDGDISEYSGDTGAFDVVSSPTYDGGNALESLGNSFNNDITRTDVTIAPSETPFGAWVQYDTVGTPSPRFGIDFAVQSATGNAGLSGYRIVLVTEFELLELYRVDDGSDTVLASADYSNGSTGTWFNVVCTEWTSSGDVTVEIRDTGGSTLASVSVTDSTYGSGGIGFNAVSDETFNYDYYYKPTTIAPPSNVQITDATTEDGLTLDWDTSGTGASGYYVYRAESSGSTTSDYTQVADVTSPPYTDTGLEDGEQFYYRVSSHD